MASRRGPDYSVRASIAGTINGINWANVFWMQCTAAAAPPQADLDAWLTTLVTKYKLRFNAEISSTVAYTQAKATMFLPGGLELASAQAVAGNPTGGAMINENAACKVISWNSGVYWRGGKPRTYLPGVPAADIGTGHLLTAGVPAGLKTNADGFLADVNAMVQGAITATKLGFVSFRSGNAERGTPLFFPFNSSTVHSRLGTQRRRLGRWVA